MNRGRHRVRAIGFALVVSLVVVPFTVADERDRPATAAAATTRYEPVQPCRLADTRSGVGFSLRNWQTARIGLDTCGLPTDAAAIVVTATIVNDAGRGFLTLYPASSTRPNAANLNWDPGITRGNTATVAVSAAGVDVFKSNGFASGHVVVDVVGAFVPATEATSGRFVAPAAPRRLVDTRGGPAPASGDALRIPVPDGVDADATALAITVTAVKSSGRGFFTAYPAGTDRPEASLLNVDRAGQFRAAATVVPINADGFDLYVDTSSHVVVDLTGWFTGPSADASSAGLFVPVAPRRIRDTRPEAKPIHPTGTIDVVLPGRLTEGVQTEPPAAVAVSMTMIDALGQGFLTAHAARNARPETASGYGSRGELTAQFGFTATSSAGLAVYSSSGTELTVDLLGWFTGPSLGTPLPPAVNPVPRQRVLAIGDSSMAGVDRNFANGALLGADFTFLARSCRRLVRPSCSGREGPIPPPTALDTINAAGVDNYDVLIMMTGYNDLMPGVASDVPTIVAAARRAGFRRIIWMTMAREFRSDRGGADSFQVYEGHNSAIRANAAVHDFMIAVEWSALVRQSPSWVYSDGIHLDRPGGWAAADVMSRAVAHVTGQPCPLPEVPGGATADVCPDPGTRPPIDVRRLYGF
jgi:hypothetical protein